MTPTLFLNEPPFQIMPALAEVVGFNEAAILQVIHFWLHFRSNTILRHGRYWGPNVPGLLCERFCFWEVKTVEFLLEQLEESGVLLTLLENFGTQGTEKYYTINYELLEKMTVFHSASATPITNNIFPLQKENSNKESSFTVETQSKGPNLYVLTAKDPAHALSCELTLEIQEEASQVVCHYPKIADDSLKKFVNQDITLCGAIMILFQAKILEKLFLFCTEHHVTNLIAFADGDQAEELEIYRSFLTHQDKDFTTNKKMGGITISTDQGTVDDWEDFMEMLILKVRQILWREQRSNPLIQQYLKIHPLPEI